MLLRFRVVPTLNRSRSSTRSVRRNGSNVRPLRHSGVRHEFPKLLAQYRGGAASGSERDPLFSQWTAGEGRSAVGGVPRTLRALHVVGRADHLGHRLDGLRVGIAQRRSKGVPDLAFDHTQRRRCTLVDQALCVSVGSVKNQVAAGASCARPMAAASVPVITGLPSRRCVAREIPMSLGRIHATPNSAGIPNRDVDVVNLASPATILTSQKQR